MTADRCEELWEDIGVITDAIGYLMGRDPRLLADAAGVLYEQLDKANAEYLALRQSERTRKGAA